MASTKAPRRPSLTRQLTPRSRLRVLPAEMQQPCAFLGCLTRLVSPVDSGVVNPAPQTRRPITQIILPIEVTNQT